MSNISASLTFILPNLYNFHSLEVVDRVSETQLQVSENSSWSMWRIHFHMGIAAPFHISKWIKMNGVILLVGQGVKGIGPG